VFLLWCRRLAKIRPWFRFAVAGVLIWGALPSVSVYAETTFLPWGGVRERYDSNVWRRPKELLTPDAQGNTPQLDDFVTTVNGGLNLRHDSRDMEADLRMGGGYSAFVTNTNLNFFNVLLNGTVGLDRLVDRYVRGARLNVSERFLYSPEQSYGSSVVADELQGGLLTFRRSTLRNATTFNGEYPLSRDFSLEGGYIFGLRLVSRETLGGDVPDATFFNTVTNTWSGGPRYHLTRNDSIAALYRQTFIIQERSGGGRRLNTNIVTFEGEYRKVFLEWTFSARGGITLVEPVGRSFPSGSLHVTTKPERDTVLDLTLSRQALPSFFLEGGARINNLARASIRHRIYERLSVQGSGMYALSQFLPNSENQFQNITGLARLEYMLTRNLRGELFYVFTHVDSETTALEYQVSRHQVGFMLSVLLESLGESLGFE